MKKIIFLLWLIPYCWAYSQPQHYNWYFGFNGGVSFSSGTPVVLGNSAISTDEGVASVSNSNGQLLFYTNGEQVINSMHQVMQNGTGLFGSFTTAQSAVIVPVTNDTSRYLIFTQAPQAGHGFFSSGYSGLAWSLVDMNFSNGLGAVISKNNLLADTTCESLCAVLHANGKESWVIVHEWGNRSFLSYRVGCDGSVSGPVRSEAGRVHFDSTQYAIGSIGCMKPSHDGTKLAIVWSQFLNESDSYGRMDIFDFDNGNGKITFRDSVNFGNQPGVTERGYGVEFSPSGNFVYASTHGLNNGQAFSHVYQTDVNSTDPDSSKKIIVTVFQAAGSLQLAPDSKIYMARLNGYPYLSALNFPDSMGTAAGFNANAIFLGGPVSTWGLPNNWNTFRQPEPFSLIEPEDTLICVGQPFVLSASQPYNDLTYNFQWNTGQSSRSIIVTEPGIYVVEASNACHLLSDTIVVTGMDCGCELQIPDIVTINNDGLNDSFYITTTNCSFEKFTIEIFSRWGTRVFASTSDKFKWLPDVSGTYYAIIFYEMNGKKESRKVIITVL